MTAPRKILLIRPDRIGDLILSLPVAETLKINLPHSRICYFVSPYAAPLAGMVKYVDEWLVDGKAGGERLSFTDLSKKIRAGKFDCIIELMPSWRTAAAGFLSGVKLRIGTSRRFYSFFYSPGIAVRRKSSGYHQTDLDLMHLELFDIKDRVRSPNLCVSDKGLVEADRLVDLKRKPFIVIHPGTGGSAPNWPLEHYRKLAVLIKRKLDVEVVITNHHTGLKGFDGCIDLGGKTDLETLAGVLSRSEIFVSGSTGPLHLADALGVSCVSFFVSRTDVGPERWGPRRNMDNIIVPPDDCICRDLRKCRCLERIPPEEALEKIKRLLANKKLSGVRKN